jgi:5-methyltetrahydrofolate--homocysteine methyltransferase
VSRPGYLDLIAERTVVFDGAMGTRLQEAGLEGNNDHFSITRPDVIESIHASYLEAGADVVETNSFQASRLRMTEWGVGDETRDINVAAARIARRCADEFETPSRPRYVAGAIGPSGMLPSSDDPALSGISFADLSEVFREQAAGLLEGGADLLVIETQQDILETRAAMDGARAAMRDAGRDVPLQVQAALDVTGRMLLGTDVAALVAILHGMRADVIGVNCSVGPEHLRDPVRFLCARAPVPVSVIPNAGLPRNVDGVAHYPLGAEEMARELAAFVAEFGAPVVGGCCGTGPDHVRALVEAVGRARRAPRQVVFEPSIASAITASALDQEPKPLLIGERVNTQGSRAFKELMLADDYDGALAIARDQVEGGAHALDVCVALTERGDEADMMAALVKRLAMGVEMPLVVDSTDAAVIARALETYPGRAVVNSINLENGRTRIDDVVPHAVRHGAALVALTIDEDGMAKTAEHKLRVARRIHDICTGEFGVDPGDLIFDALTFTLATGQDEFRRAAVETIEGIRAIKRELPGVRTVLGVSNLSFGLDPHSRGVLNSVFLHHAIEAGLDAAIINPVHVRPIYEISAEERELADDLVFDRRPDALARYIAHFAEVEATADEREDPLAGLATDERIHAKILHRVREGVEEDVDAALDERGGRANDQAVEVLNDVLLPAMKDVGDRFGAGELILPFVLQSAEVMKRSVAHLEQYLDRIDGQAKATVVLATVFGDVHDIGKNLVATILSNNGYRVVDLGRQVPLNVIMDRAAEERADAVGLSALLVSTSRQMPAALHELDHRGMHLPVLVGGAAINRAFGRRIAFLEDGRPYEPGVFYCRDAFEGLAVMDALSDVDTRPGVIAERRREAEEARDAPARPVPEAAEGDRGPGGRAGLRSDVAVPTPPFLGARAVAGIDAGEMFALMDERSLYKLSWGGKGVRGEEWERLVRDDFGPRRARMQADALAAGWIVPRAAYGYFHAVADGDDTVALDPDGGEAARFSFPRQERHDRLCISDYLRERGGRPDLIALQLVTVGREATAHIDALQAAEEYSEAYFAHGLAVEAAEGLAEHVHRRIREELGLERERGRRYSWGYPACPDLEQHELVLRLLAPGLADIGVELSAGFQFIPEQTTAAIVIHHPEAIYFSARRGVRSGA